MAGTFSPDDNISHLTATVDNQNTKAVDVDKLVVHLVYSDHTEHTVNVPNAAGAKIAAGANKTFVFSDSANGATLTSMDIPAGGFAFHTDGQTACASQ